MRLHPAGDGKGEFSFVDSDLKQTHTFCSFGGDAFLSGEGAYQTIMGIQSAGVQATAKHYINK